MTNKANDTQVGGNHYKQSNIQPWDAIIDWGLGFLDGNVIKYVARWHKKNGLEDLKKARHYLDKLIEQEESKLSEFKSQSPSVTPPYVFAVSKDTHGTAIDSVSKGVYMCDRCGRHLLECACPETYK